MTPSRLNALTDGVVAIVMTIMVLELKFPAEPTLAAALAVLPLLAAYLLAFIFVAIFWNNHSVCWEQRCLQWLPRVMRWLRCPQPTSS